MMDCTNSSGIGAVSAMDSETAVMGLRSDVQDVMSAVSRLEKSMTRMEAMLNFVMANMQDKFLNNTDKTGDHGKQFVSFGSMEDKNTLPSLESRNTSIDAQSLQDIIHKEASMSLTSMTSQYNDTSVPPLAARKVNEEYMDEDEHKSMNSTENINSRHSVSDERPDSSWDVERESSMKETTLVHKHESLAESTADTFSKIPADRSKGFMSNQWDDGTKCVPYHMLRRERTEPVQDNRVTVLVEEGLEVKFDSIGSQQSIPNGGDTTKQNTESVNSSNVATQSKKQENKIIEAENVLLRNGVDPQKVPRMSECFLESEKEEIRADQNNFEEVEQPKVVEEESQQQEAVEQRVKTVPEQPSQIDPKQMPQTGPEPMPQTGPEPMPQTRPESMPQTGPEQMPQTGPEQMPQTGPEQMPQTGPEQMPQTGPEPISQTGPEQTTDSYTEELTSFTSTTEHTENSYADEENETKAELISQDTMQKLILDEADNASKCTDPKSDGMDTILCLDISGSMVDQSMQFMKNAVISFLDGLEFAAVEHGLEENVAIVTFGKQNKVLQHLTNDYGCIRDVIDSLEAGGPSPLMTGLMLCLSALNGRGGEVCLGKHIVPPRIIIFTDARATQERQLSGPEIVAGEKDSEMRKRFLEFGERLSEESKYITCVPVGDCDEDVLELLSQMNGGKIVPPKEVCNLSRHFYLNTIVSKEIGESPKQKLKKESIIEKVWKTYPDINQYDVDFISEQLTLSFCNENGEMPDLPMFGTRVRRGQNWKWDDQDSNGVGTIIAHKGEGHVGVLWDNGKKGRYRFRDDSFDVKVVDEPRVILPDELLDVGAVVKRGTDWKWGDQDGGLGTEGVVFRLDLNGVIHVRWPNGKRGNYRYGYDKKYDVAAYNRPTEIQQTPSPQVSLETQQTVRPQLAVPPSATVTQKEKEHQRPEKVVWEWESEPETWKPYPQDLTGSLEAAFKTQTTTTKLISMEDQMYRVSLGQYKQWPVNNKADVRNIRRTVLPD